MEEGLRIWVTETKGFDSNTASIIFPALRRKTGSKEEGLQQEGKGCSQVGDWS